MLYLDGFTCHQTDLETRGKQMLTNYLIIRAAKQRVNLYPELSYFNKIKNDIKYFNKNLNITKQHKSFLHYTFHIAFPIRNTE